MLVVVFFSFCSSFWCLQKADGVLVPGGFGIDGVDGKIRAAQYARTKEIPFLGICLGMQIAVIEFMRNVSHSTSPCWR